MLDVAVGNKHRNAFLAKRYGLYFLTDAIQQHEFTGLAEHAGNLIHDAAGHASKNMLCMLTENRFF